MKPVKTIAWRVRAGQPVTYGTASALIADLRKGKTRASSEGAGFAVQGEGMGINGGGSSCIDLDPLFM